jgi:nucleoside-triphosphatase THEP1
MLPQDTKLILWTGTKQSGKTTAVSRLIDHAVAEGFSVAGLLSLAQYDNGTLVGFDVQDISTHNRTPLARRGPQTPHNTNSAFTFIKRGLELGHLTLNSPDTHSAQLIIIDEFGPLEIENHGWRKSVDTLLASAEGLLLLVVREKLLEKVRDLYAQYPCAALPAQQPEAVKTVVDLLVKRFPSNQQPPAEAVV